jgi:hypothetical protein
LNANDVIASLQEAFDEYDLNKIEDGLGHLAKLDKSPRLEELFTKLKEAYDNLEYDDGAASIEDYYNGK